MEPTRTFTIHLDLHWRAIVAAVCIVAVLVLGLSVTSALGSGARNVNDPQVQAARVYGQSPAAATPDPPSPDCGALVPTPNGECVAPEAVGTGSSSPEQGGAVTTAGQGIRHVYVTDQQYYPDQALTACGPGYHMASLWEILDTSNWVYDYDHPAARVHADSGHGPPSQWFGWVRTGYYSSADDVPGTGNCLAWTSRSDQRHGSLVRLTRQWETAPGEILTWDAHSFSCYAVAAVWCVRD